MKKFIPFILVGIGLIVVVGAIIFVKFSKKDKVEESPIDEETVAEISIEDRPIVSLIPSVDGHWLTLTITDIGIDASTLDYELVYQVEDGRTQGVPGTIKLANESGPIVRELLLGSESSGKFRYDAGVESGVLTLRFRNDKGKLIGKLSTDFKLLSKTDELKSADGKLTFKSDDELDGFYIVMNVFGLPDSTYTNLTGPYGVFTKESNVRGKVEIQGDGKVFLWDKNNWHEVDSETSLGIFIKAS
ncbi:MAG TPA: hypothetical protein VI819_01850 [Patescibacteria group bacterium]|nr:hypothetical protein [Patescibacteria group bacterium]